MKRILMFLKTMFFAPMILLMRVDGGGEPSAAGNAAGGVSAVGTNSAQGDNSQPAAPDASTIAAELMNAIERRAQRSEGSISRAIAEKYGMTEQEISDILAAEKARRDKALPADVQKRIDDALAASNDRLISAEIRTQATAMGFVDTDDALHLLDRSGVKVTENSEVEGVKEALEALAKAKPHLLKKQGAWGERHGSSAPAEKTYRDEIREKLYGGNN